MPLYNYIIAYIGIIICHLISIRCYKLILGINEFKLNYKHIIFILFISVITYLNNQYNYEYTRLAIHFLICCLLYSFMFKNDLKTLFVNTSLFYLTLCIFEILIGIFLMIFFDQHNFGKYNENYIFKTMLSTIVVLFTLIPFEIEKIRIVFNKLSDYIINRNVKLLNMIMLILFLLVSTLLYNGAYNLSFKGYMNNLIIFLIFSCLIIIFIRQHIKIKKAEEKEEILLTFMSKYEKIIDKDRILRHEILNNLIILRSFDNKNSKKYNETLNSIINEYKCDDDETFSNIYNLPSGLKGLLYYKINDMRGLNIIVNLNISNKVLKLLDALDLKKLIKIYKILGILLDNSREATEKLKNKLVIIDIYSENKDIIFYIENTTKMNVNLKKIYDKNYSTKSKNRGLGLYIVDKIVKSSKNIEFKQFINEQNNFVSILKTKNYQQK